MADIRVITVPTYVEVICDNCEEEIRMTYEEFTDIHGDPPDWNYEEIKCPECGYVNHVDSWEFD